MHACGGAASELIAVWHSLPPISPRVRLLHPCLNQASQQVLQPDDVFPSVRAWMEARGLDAAVSLIDRLLPAAWEELETTPATIAMPSNAALARWSGGADADALERVLAAHVCPAENLLWSNLLVRTAVPLSCAAVCATHGRAAPTHSPAAADWLISSRRLPAAPTPAARACLIATCCSARTVAQPGERWAYMHCSCCTHCRRCCADMRPSLPCKGVVC